MVQTTGIALVVGVWASLYLADAFLKNHKWTSRPYHTFLNSTGLNVSVAQLRWYTTYFNRLFVRLGQCKPHFLKVWFTLGVAFGLVAMVTSVLLLTLLVYNTLQQQPVEKQILTPVMPGVNLPMNQLAYYLLTLLVCAILHEMGHALAAVREQVRINGFGLFILAIYPGAFVDLFTEHLQMISPLRQLRIYCAGVWHNFIIVLLALMLLAVLPWGLAPIYSTGHSVVITDVSENSAVSGNRGLVIGDQVTHISNCRVTSMEDWSTCVSVSMKEQSIGHCVTSEQIKTQDISYQKSFRTINGNTECCNTTSRTHLCFTYFLKKSLKTKYACLPARTTTDRHTCKLQSDCYNPKTEMSCVTPSLDNSTKLLRVYKKGRPPLIFLGHPLDLHYSVSISNHVPRYTFVPVHMPYVIETFCKYLISLSGALAILNVVPCYALDGQWILIGFIEYSLKNVIEDTETRGLICTILLLFGTMLLGTNLVIALWTLFR